MVELSNCSRIIQKVAEIQQNVINFVDVQENEAEKDRLLETLHINIVKYQILSNKSDLVIFLQFLCQIMGKYKTMIKKTKYDRIGEILKKLSSEIKATISQRELFFIFHSQLVFLHWLIESSILSIDVIIENFEGKDRLYLYLQFFFPEIRSKDKQTFLNLMNLLDNKKLAEKFIRRKEKNLDLFLQQRNYDEYEESVLSVISEGNIDNFISMIDNDKNLCPDKKIKAINKFHDFSNVKCSLIEYAAKAGSISIFKYLLMNNVDINENIWKSAIEGNNSEIIQILEDKKIPKQTSDLLVIHSIECLHNELAHYFEQGIDGLNYPILLNELRNSFNIMYLNDIFSDISNMGDLKSLNVILIYACQIGWIELAEALLKIKGISPNFVNSLFCFCSCFK